MKFTTSVVLAALAAVVAAGPNPFSISPLPTTVDAGTPWNITWVPSTGSVDTVSLFLKQGVSTNLATVSVIATNITNSGSYVWTPSEDIVKGDLYALEIVDDANPDLNNYTGQFSIDSTNTVSSSTMSSTTSSSSSSSTGSSSSSGSSSATTTGSSSKSSSSATKTSSSTPSSTASASASATKNAGERAVKLGGGMLAVVGAVMAGL